MTECKKSYPHPQIKCWKGHLILFKIYKVAGRGNLPFIWSCEVQTPSVMAYSPETTSIIAHTGVLPKSLAEVELQRKGYESIPWESHKFH